MSQIACTVQISEGRDPEFLESFRRRLRAAPPVRLLDHVADPDQNRSAWTFCAPEQDYAEACLALAREVIERIDLEQQGGSHPKVGSLDELAFFPLAAASLEDCVRVAREVGERLGAELELPVYFGDEAATRPELRRVAALRHIGFDGLRRSEGSERWIEPDAGPRERLHPRAGATIVMARPALTLVEVELASQEMASARRIVDALRRDPTTGSMRMAASALSLEGFVAVDVELRDPARVGIVRILQRIDDLARENGTSVRSLRIEGLVPEAALAHPPEAPLPLVDFAPEKQVYERLLVASA